ncbi:diguanylate cyclase [Geitlerinema sp. PCC 9228]|uniref:diguanylate cyclase domain-containing protein n=1 Tax=Geitlerinema sp. PCC 9228 TaxID=111611 RepID=UPI000ABE63D6|nr:diguanylate cyclase [Geitlerinema sp. PCC 9228]
MKEAINDREIVNNMSPVSGETWYSAYVMPLLRFYKGLHPRRIAVLLAMGATVLGVSAVAFTSYRMVRGLFLHNFKENTRLQVKQGVTQINDWFAAHQVQLEAIANSPTLRTMDIGKIQPYLQDETTRLKNFYSLAFIAANDRSYTTNGEINLDQLRDRDYFQKAMAGKLAMGKPHFNRDRYSVTASLAVPVWPNSPNQSSRQPMGVLVGEVSLNEIAYIVSTLHYGNGSYSLAIDSTGQPLIYSRYATKVATSAATNEPNPTLPSNVVRKPTPELLQISDKIAKQSAIEETIPMALGSDAVYVSRWSIDNRSWSVVLVVPKQHMQTQLEPLNLLATVMSVLLGLTAIVAQSQWSLLESFSGRAQQEALLNRLTGKIRASLELEEILPTTVEEVGKLLGLERAAFGWYDPIAQVLDIKWEYKQPDLRSQVGRFSFQPLSAFSEKLDQGEAVVHQTRLSINLPLVSPADGVSVSNSQWQNASELPSSQSPPDYDQPMSLPLDNSRYMTVPVRTQGEPVGYLICTHVNRWLWRTEDRELLQSIADQLAIAIQQATLYQQLEDANQELHRLASIDSLTQVFNRRSFDERINQELWRLVREKAPLSLILIDIDRFKAYNDTYGHPTGDTCLQKVAQAINKAVQRPADLVARYGGEEFGVLLPHTDAEGAVVVAERVRSEVRHLQIEHVKSPIDQRLTVSIGVATIIPKLESTAESLIQQADWALYEAKNAGRDRVQTYHDASQKQSDNHHDPNSRGTTGCTPSSPKTSSGSDSQPN